MQAIFYLEGGDGGEGNTGQGLPPLYPDLIPWTTHHNLQTPSFLKVIFS